MGRRKVIKGLSLAEYAAHRGCSPNTVTVAKRTGRLRKCMLPSGRIRSAAEADAEWAANTQHNRIPLTGPTAPRANGSIGAIEDLAEARFRREAALAETAEIELKKMKGELVDAKAMEAVMAADYSAVRTKLLGVAARARQMDPTLTEAQIPLFDDLQREPLEDLPGDASDDPEGAEGSTA
mgnify:CR=1 FL=1